ncbi:MAG: hypothetical protein IPN57_13235 [Ignavibacteria bacterium]|nr:hypothetical protein [Ignavibacteria bacterium]
MKNKIIFAASLILILVDLNVCLAVRPTYKLTAQNFTFRSANELVFDIYILHTNPADTVFQFAIGQYYFNFDTMFCAGGSILYDFAPGNTGDSSDFPFAARPRNPTRNGSSLRVNSNTVLGLGNGPIVSGVTPGSKIIRMRLRTTAAAFSSTNLADLNLRWRNANAGNPFSKIFVYIGGLNTEITDSTNHFIDILPYNYPLITLNNPQNNSINNPVTVYFIWRKDDLSVAYIFQVFSDSLLENIILSDTINNNIDTVKSVSGFSKNTKYYWRVGGKSDADIVYYSLAWKFTTFPGIILNLKIIPEGIYYNIFNLLSRRDTVTVYLRNITSPYSKIDSLKAIIDSINFTGAYTFPNVPSGTYYIATKHLNSIETWSKAGGEPMTINGTTNYDFTTAASQAFGNNLKLKGSKYCAYSGDINQDGIIDASDLIKVYNDSYAGLTGRYIVSDLNGDSVVDASDISTTDNNVFAGILKIIP